MIDDPRPVLVTGANGHLGRLLLAHVDRCPKRAVRAAVRSERAAVDLAALKLETLSSGIEIVDYGDHASLAAALKGCRAVVHLVGIIRETAQTHYRQAHEQSCEALVRAMAEADVGRIVYMSILGASANSPNACLASKGRAEEILLQAPNPTTVLRVPMVLGPDDHASNALRAQAKARVVPLIRGGTTWQQPIDAADVVLAMVAAIADSTLDNSALDLAGAESVMQRDLIRRAAELYDNRPAVIPVPLVVARMFARLAEGLSSDPPLTLPMLEVLERDDRVDPLPAAGQLGIDLTPLDDTLQRYVGPEEIAL